MNKFLLVTLCIFLIFGLAIAQDSELLMDMGLPQISSEPEPVGGLVKAPNPMKAMLGRAPLATKNIPSNEPTILLRGINGPAYGADVFNDQLLKFWLNAPTTTTVQGPNTMDLYCGDFDGAGIFYAINQATGNLVTIDTSNGIGTVVGADTLLRPAGHVWTGMSWDATTNTMYASSTNGTQTTIYTLDLTTPSSTTVGTTTTAPTLIDIAVEPTTGQMYGHDLNDQIYLIDKTNATATLLGATGFDANYAQGMDFNPETGELYLAAYNNANSNGELRLVNLTNGNAALIGTIGAGLNVEVAAFGIVGTAGDDLDPKAPENFTAYSDYTTPAGMSLNWTDPTEYVNGDPLTNFQIIIARDAVIIDSVNMGVETYTDAGLTDGQLYAYDIWAKDINDSTSNSVSVSWTAGGSPTPNPPTAFSITNAGGGLMAHWVNPSTNVDGTPMDDFDAINLYEDGTILTTFTRSPGDTGAADSAMFTPGGVNLPYYVTAMDNETPANESATSTTAYPPFSAPYFQDFESATPGTPGVLPLLWTNETDDDHDWYVDEGGTPSASTGPTVDHTLGTAAGNYMFIESSSPYFNVTAHLTSPFVDLTGVSQPGMAFWYHMYGQTMGDLHVDVFANGVWNLDVMPPLIGQQQQNQTDPWLQAVIDLSAYAGSGPIQARFRGITGSDFYSDMAIDDVFMGSLNSNPQMVVTPLTIGDTLLVGGTNTHTVTVSNASPLPNSLNYTVTENPSVSWMDVMPTSGTVTSGQSEDLTVTLDATSLTSGIYNAELIVAGDDSSNLADTVDVTLVVNDAPDIEVAPDTFDVSVVSGSTLDTTLTIYNNGIGPLTFELSVGGALPELMYYKFDEAGANQTENFAAPGSPAPPTAGVLGGLTMGGTGFDGAALIGSGGSSSTDYVDTGWITNISGSWTISMWLSGTWPSAIAYIFGDNTASSFRCFTAGAAGVNGLLLRSPNGSAYDVQLDNVGPGTAIVDYVYDDAALELRGYVNGVLMATVPQNAPIVLSGTAAFKVAGYSSSAGLAAGMLMDEWKWFTEAVDPTSRGVEAFWLSADTTSGTVAPGDSMQITLTFDPTGLLGGDYDTDILVMSNDPVDPEVNVGVHMFVIAEPDIAVSPDSIIFDSPVVVGAQDTLALTVYNNGAGVLDITNVASTNSVFTVSTTNFTVGPYDSLVVDVIFTPTSAAVETGTLTLSSNDPDTPSLDVYMEGEGISAPVIGVSPDSVSVVVPSGSVVMDTVTISNSGVGPLFFDIAIEGVTKDKTKIDIIGDPQLGNDDIIAVGRSVSFAELEYLRSSIEPQLRVNPGQVSDIDLAFEKGIISGMQPNKILGEEIFGSTQNIYGPSGARGRGNFFTCTNSTTLIEHRFYLNVPTSTTMWFVVAESPTQVGNYTLINASDVSPSGTGEGWYSSGPINVPLVAGNYYLIFAQWEAAANYYNEQNISPFPIPASFGELTGGAGYATGSVPAYSVPPATTHPITSAAFVDPVAYYQTIVTAAGVDWLSVDTTQGMVPPGSSMDVVVSFDPAGLLGGDYYANMAISSNDPVTPLVDLNVHMFVQAEANIGFNPDPIIFDSTFVNGTSTISAHVLNSGAGVLNVSNIQSTNSAFSMDTMSFNCPPLDSFEVNVSYNPTSAGSHTGWLLISSNDPNTPVDSVWVQGEAVLAPQMSLTPSAIMDSVAIHDSMDVAIQISNAATGGAANLDWSAALASLTKQLHIPPASPDFPKGDYPPSMGRAPDSKPGTANPPFNSTLAPGSAWSIEQSNDFITYFDLATPQVLNNLAADPNTADFDNAGDFGLGDQSYFYLLSNDNSLRAIDTSSGASALLGSPVPNGAETWSAMATDPTDGTIYAISLDVGVSSSLFTIDPATGSSSLIGQTGMTGLISLAIDGNGDMWGHDLVSDVFVSIDKTTGTATTVGSLGFDANFGQGMTWDPESDQLYMAAFNASPQQPELRIVDKTTGGSVLVGIPGQTTPGGTCQLGFIAIPGAEAGAQFIKLLPPTSGSINPGDVQTLTARIYGLDVVDTTYYANIEVTSNDPLNPIVTIPVEIKAVLSTGIDDNNSIPYTYAISQNYPNPFNPSTTFKYQLPEMNDVKLVIYNILGQKVRTLINRQVDAGYHSVVWDGRNDYGRQVATGVYIYRFQAGDYMRTMKMLMLK